MKRTKVDIAMTALLTTMMLLAAGFMFSACSTDDTPASSPTTPDSEIRLNADVWRMMEGTRATTFDGGTLTSDFVCTAYDEYSTTGNETVDIIGNTVTWNGAGWDFSGGRRYWPDSETTLDFFAYMPTTIPAYITNTSDVAGCLTYAARNPQFKCKNLPMSYDGASPALGQGTGLQEFVYALEVGRNKANSSSGVSLHFQHPFTKIYLKWANYNHAAISNLTVKLQGIKNNGTYSGGSWSTTGAATDFTTTTLDENAATPTAFLMIPQNWAGDIEVVTDWVDWGDTFSHTIKKQVATNWQAGYSYTYTFTITPSELIVVTDKFTEQW